MTTLLLTVAAIAGLAGGWYWNRVQSARALREERAEERANLARGLMEAALATAQTSEAAAAALKLVAEAVQGTGEMGFLESRVLAERVAEGASLDARAHLAPCLDRVGIMLQEVAGARELIRVMDPAGARDASLRDDALQHLDAATQAYLGSPQA
jgi:hypothetical protein